ncbi:hypothetical protein RsS62_12790 [Rhizobium dioscoreae]|nr:hypothetical protein RsS62_12790 [Rhizobium dioscoreae]
MVALEMPFAKNLAADIVGRRETEDVIPAIDRHHLDARPNRTDEDIPAQPGVEEARGDRIPLAAKSPSPVFFCENPTIEHERHLYTGAIALQTDKVDDAATL